MKILKQNDQNELLNTAILSEDLCCSSPDTIEVSIIEKGSVLEPPEYQFGSPSLWYLWLSPRCCKMSAAALSCFEGTDISDKKIMRSLPLHRRRNADACIHVTICHSYCLRRLIRVWVWGCVAWNEERSPVCWINGVNNSLRRFSDYAHTDSHHSGGRQTKTAQSKPATHRTHTYIHARTQLCTFTYT